MFHEFEGGPWSVKTTCGVDGPYKVMEIERKLPKSRAVFVCNVDVQMAFLSWKRGPFKVSPHPPPPLLHC